MATRPRYRLMIEGCPTEWVTDSSLETTVSDGRIRRQGLLYDGLCIEEDLDLRESTTRIAGNTFKIVSEFADGVFAFHPEHLGTLADDVDDDDAIFYLENYTGLISVDDIIHIGSEACKVTSASSTYSYVGVTRQYWDTQAQGHYKEVGERYEIVPMYNRVPSYEGRRCYLFQYDEGDTSDESPLFDFTSNNDGRDIDTADNVVWRGVISGAPRLDRDGVTWLIDCEPITYLLDQEIAKEEFDFSVKGIYHHALCGLCIEAVDYDAGEPYPHTYETVKGFYPTEDDFIGAVNTALETIRTTAFTNTPQGLSLTWEPGRGYRLDVHIHASTDSEFDVRIYSPLVGVFGVDGSYDLWYGRGSSEVFGVGEGVALPNDNEFYKYVDASLSDGFFENISRGVFFGGGAGFGVKRRSTIVNVRGDRAILGNPTTRVKRWDLLPYIADRDDISSYPPLRLYINKVPPSIVTIGTILYIKTSHDGEEIGCRCEVTAGGSDGTYGTAYIEIKSYDPDFWPFLPVLAGAEITVIYDYGNLTNIAGFIDNVITQAVDANKGGTPFIKYSDIDILSLVGLALDLPANWSFQFTGSNLLHDVIREHLKLYSWFMHLNSNGLIAFGKLEPATVETAAIDDTLDADNIVTKGDHGGDFPMLEPAIDGVVSVVEIERGYDWRDESFTESKKVTVRDAISVSTHKNRSRGVTVISARGNYHGENTNDIPTEECLRAASDYLSFHAHDYDVVKIKVLASVFDNVVCGSWVKVTSPHIPDTSAGTRGIEDRVGIVIGREQSLDPKDGAVGTLTVRLERESLHGYAPSLRITDYTVYSGYTYTCTIEQNYHAPSGYNDVSFFAVDDKIRVIEFGTVQASPFSQTGTISAIVSATEIRVTLAFTFPFGLRDLWDLSFANDTGTLEDGQTDYCYVADSNELLYDNSIGRRFR